MDKKFNASITGAGKISKGAHISANEKRKMYISAKEGKKIIL